MPAAHVQKPTLVTTTFVLLHTLLPILFFLSSPTEAVASSSSSARSRNRKDNAAYYHSKRARRHGAQFTNFLAIIKVVFFFTFLPVLVYFVWSLAADPDTPRVLRYLYMAAHKKVYRALGWASPHTMGVQATVSAPLPQGRQGHEEEGDYFGDPLGDVYHHDLELRKDK